MCSTEEPQVGKRGTLHNVCTGHWKDIMSIQGVFSALGDIIQYTERCPVGQGITMSTPEEYHDACGGYHEHTWGSILLY